LRTEEQPVSNEQTEAYHHEMARAKSASLL